MEEKKEPQKSPESAPQVQQGTRYEHVLMHEAYEHMRKSEYWLAVEVFNDILRRFGVTLDDKQKSLIHSELGTLYFWLGDYDAARAHCEHSLAYADNNDQAYNILGKIAVAQFKFPVARGYFSKISESNPARDLGLCLISIKLRDTLGAEEFLARARGKGIPLTDPEYAVYSAYFRLLLGDAKSAAVEARALLQKCEHEPNLMLLIAEIFMTAGNYGEATAAAEKVRKICPQNDGVFAILAHTTYAQEDYAKADDNAHESLKFNPLNAYAKTVLIKLAVRRGSYSFAESIAMQVLQECPEYSLAHANLGDVYFLQGRHELAKIEYKQTQQLMTADTKGARLRQARMKFIDEDYREAAKILEQLILAHHTYYDDAMCDLALCYDKLGDEQKRDEVAEKMEMRKSFYHRTEKILREFEEE